ncbi:UPF0175 family protein [Algoriphagus sp. H41]|uniref:UPF0175 family protein n=1 Tax=Algoriphagus oliviformis TaxID=2811231 RepID=A0ABS3BZ53_9BACT|nr:UPF0175 family protein [Algoriphagus oliviformis]MBN7810096.1 UPF0175 family protein [Algoriphagus oliviformis]
MKVILELPEKPELKNMNVTEYLAAKMYQDALLSAGQAAQLLGIPQEQFIDLLGDYGVSVFSDEVEDIRRDIDNA